jgi:hypothetical protein
MIVSHVRKVISAGGKTGFSACRKIIIALLARAFLYFA